MTSSINIVIEYSSRGRVCRHCGPSKRVGIDMNMDWGDIEQPCELFYSPMLLLWSLWDRIDKKIYSGGGEANNSWNHLLALCVRYLWNRPYDTIQSSMMEALDMSGFLTCSIADLIGRNLF
ncbi:unnamed protein product [Rhodiola kirilowii]